MSFSCGRGSIALGSDLIVPAEESMRSDMGLRYYAVGRLEEIADISFADFSVALRDFATAEPAPTV